MKAMHTGQRRPLITPHKVLETDGTTPLILGQFGLWVGDRGNGQGRNVSRGRAAIIVASVAEQFEEAFVAHVVDIFAGRDATAQCPSGSHRLKQ